MLRGKCGMNEKESLKRKRSVLETQYFQELQVPESTSYVYGR